MITTEAVTVLCFGDSNTFGATADGSAGGRWPADVRWTGRLSELLGQRCRVIEEGLGGRTTDLDYPFGVSRPGRNGRAYLLPCLDSHWPIDVVVLMLGTNDLKMIFGRSTADIGAAIGTLLDDLASNAADRAERPSRVVLLSPVPIDDGAPDFAAVNGASYDADSVRKSGELAGVLAELAAARQVAFADLGTVAKTGADGVHLSRDSHLPVAELVADKIAEVLASQR
ncbi:MAG: hypothetical protein J2O49_08480 [Sciscionella sp.]|nr:hypothetical protein [Sciscionella sp.]